MERVEFRQDDALELPFSAAEFDVVVCQFGVMFFPERVAAYRQALRVLEPGGQFILNVWDKLSLNPFSKAVSDAMAERFPQDPPQVLVRVPYTYNDNAVIRADLAAARFATVAIEVVAKTSRAVSHRDPTIGVTRGSPMRNEIEARDPNGLQAATVAAADALAARFGIGAIEAPMQAHVIVASRGCISLPHRSRRSAVCRHRGRCTSDPSASPCRPSYP
jgi:SAM-dependent methyltransferase